MLTRFKVSVFARPAGTLGAYRRYSIAVDAPTADDASMIAMRRFDSSNLTKSNLRDVDVVPLDEVA